MSQLSYTNIITMFGYWFRTLLPTSRGDQLYQITQQAKWKQEADNKAAEASAMAEAKAQCDQSIKLLASELKGFVDTSADNAANQGKLEALFSLEHRILTQGEKILLEKYYDNYESTCLRFDDSKIYISWDPKLITDEYGNKKGTTYWGF